MSNQTSDDELTREGRRELLAKLLQEKGGQLKSFPVSYAQQRIWFLDQLEPGNPAYNIPTALRFRGALSVRALEQSLREIVRRHDTLRTKFVAADGEPRQVVLQHMDLPVQRVDLRHLDAEGRQAEAWRLAAEDSQRPFDLARGPLLRVTLLQLADEEFVIVLCLHHVIGDAWSRDVLVRELATLYEAFRQGKPSPLPDLPIQYAEYAVWQRQWLRGQVLDSQLDYWRRQLNNLPVLDLPTDRLRPPVQTSHGDRRSLLLPEELSSSLKELCQREGVTLFMMLLAAFDTLLYRYTGQDDIVVGSPFANRGRDELEGIIGFFVNTIVMRTDLSGSPSFRTLLQRVRGTCLGAQANQDLPFEYLVDALQPERDLSRTPLFQVFFNVFAQLPSRISLSDAVVERLPLGQVSSKFDLTLYATEGVRQIELMMGYNVDLFQAETIEWMLETFRTLLESIAEDPGQSIAALSLLTQAQRRRLASCGNRVRPSVPFEEFPAEEVEQSVQSRFAKQVERHGDRVAVKTGNHAWTYEELNARANQVARAVAATTGGAAEHRIALLFGHDAPMVAGMLGVLKAGQTFVPLDHSYPEERLAYILEDSAASAILTNSAHAGLGRGLARGGLRVINTDELEHTAGGDDVNLSSAPGDVACLLYSSGSTGQPKGTLQTHRAMLHVVRNYTNNLHLNARDRLTLFSSYSHVAAMTDVFSCLLNGATLYPLDVREGEVSDVGEWMAREGITIYHSIPTLYRYLVDTLRDGAELPALRAVVLGGEEVLDKDFQLFKKHFPQGCLFVNMCGSTEVTSTTMYITDHRSEAIRSPMPVGFAVGSNEILLLNEAGLEAQVYGEIAVRSPFIPSGYWRRPKESAAAFLPDPDGGDRRIYRTGDHGRRLWDGSLVLLGRKDLQVKIRGFRIELGEIESVLSNHPAVDKAFVLAWPGTSSEKRLAAYVLMKRGREATVSELRDFLKEKLPTYMMPAAFVLLDALPLTPNGKVDRKSLPAPDWASLELDGSFVAPRTETEKAVAEVWREVLKLDRVGVHDSFFDLGGHSLLATQILSRLRRTYQVALPLRKIFEAPTVAGMSEVIDSERQTRGPSQALPPAIKPVSREARRLKKNL